VSNSRRVGVARLHGTSERPRDRSMSDRVVVDRVCDAIFAELDRQHEADEIGGNGYWDSEWGCLDGEPKWGEVARAAIRAVHADAEEKP